MSAQYQNAKDEEKQRILRGMGVDTTNTKAVDEVQGLFTDEAKRITKIADYAKAKRSTLKLADADELAKMLEDDTDDESVLSEGEVFKRAIILTGANIEHIPGQMRL